MLQRVDPIETVRRHPRMYVPPGLISGDILTARLLLDALFTGQGAVLGLRFGEWWIAASESDWIAPAQGGRTLVDYFYSVVAFPERSVNDFHAEVLLTAFAHRVVTLVRGGTLITLVGEVPSEDLVGRVERSLPGWNRLVAFQVTPADYRDLD